MQVPSDPLARAIPARLIAALAGAAALAIPGVGAAATVVQSASFSELHGVTIQFGFSMNPAPATAADDLATHVLGFEGFDTSLGALTGARWQLASDQDYGTGIAVFGLGGVMLSNTRAHSFVEVAGDRLGDVQNTVLPSVPIECGANAETQDCVTVVHTLDTFDLDVEADDLSPFLQPGGVEALLVSRVLLTARDDGFGYFFPYAAATGVLDWSGALSLTYTYEPAAAPPTSAAPEPLTWTLMIAGFGLVGAGLRRRRAMASDSIAWSTGR